MFRKVIALLGALTIIGVWLVACAPSAPAPTPTSPPVTAATPTRAAPSTPAGPAATATSAPQAKVTLKFITISDDVQVAAWKEILAAFQKTEGGKWSQVDLAFDSVPFVDLFPKILTNVAVGAEMDLFQADGPVMKHYAFNRALLPIAKYLSDAEMKQWAPQSIEEGSFRGQLYGLPIMQSCSMLMYNKEMTDAAGVKPPTKLEESWTFEQALEAWKKTTKDLNGDGIPDIWGVRLAQGTSYGDYETGIWRRSAGTPGSNTYKGMADDGITFRGYLDTPEAIQAMTFWQQLHTVHKVTPIEPIPSIFETKKSAFMVTPDNRIGALNRLYPQGDFKWGATGIPYFKTQICHTGSWHYGIAGTIKPEKLDAAVAFVKFASGDAGARIWYKNVRQLPANVALFNELPEYKSDGAQALFVEGFRKIGIPRVQSPGYQEYFSVFLEMATDISTGGNVSDLMKKAAQRAESALARYKGWNK